VAGLESITSGELWIGDRLVNDMPPKERDIAMVFQNYALYPHMTVYDNMAFALTLRKMPKAEIDKRVREAADILGLGPYLTRKPRQLSGGQRQRVAVGRAIVRQPQAFLFDEPLSNLDAKLRVQTRREITRLQHQLGATTVYVTHDQVEAMTMGDRIVVMKDGRVQQVDTPLALYERPENVFVAGFIGSPAMNLLRGTLARADGLRFVAADGGVEIPLPAQWSSWLAPHMGSAVVLGARPEHISLAAAGSPQAAVVPARLELAEPMGSEIYLQARAGTHELTVRIPPQPLPPEGSELRLVIDLNHAHLFDAATERRLNPAA
jgi:multiple sugar transport system ATP-binding protein